MDYFYSQQLRAYRLQIMRVFSGFSVSFGTNADGSPILRRVPCRWGDASRLVETIISGGSENKMPSVPFISVYTTGLSIAPERRQNPTMTSTVSVTERAYNTETGAYLDTPGNAYSVTRYMPVAFNLTVMVDFWTSNLDQKEQLLEQVLVLFNGMIDIQTSVNGVDWSALTAIEHTNITWSSRTVPIGIENPIDVASVEYKIPIWINPPAQVQYQTLIQQINTSISDGTYDPVAEEWDTISLLSNNIATPDDARIHVSLVSENLYDVELQTAAGSNIDTSSQSTRVQAAVAPQLTPGSAFKFNGYSVTVPNNNVNDLVKVIKNQIQDTALNVVLNLRGSLEFWNNSGGDVVLENVTGSPVNQLGFQSAAYQGGTLAWWRLLESYGTAQIYSATPSGSPSATNSTQLLLMPSPESTSYSGSISGTLTPHPTDLNRLRWTPDMSTWPKATLQPVTAVIDPQVTFPGAGISETAPGQRYLLINTISEDSLAWGKVSASTNDIIEWDGAQWIKSFDAAAAVSNQYLQNRFSKKWLEFSAGEWNIFPQQSQVPGNWRLKF